MRSFGLWYKKVKETDKTPIFSMHINFWSESVKMDSEVPDLDVGIKIKDFIGVDELIFHCPFLFGEQEVLDLIPKLCVKENANIVYTIPNSKK